VLWFCHSRAVRGAQSQATGVKRPLFLSTCTGTVRIHILLTSKKWRFQSGCNHSTAYVDQSKG